MGAFGGNSENGRGGGFSTRFMGALLMAAVAFIMYMTNTQENPVTGEKQHVTITPDQEIKLGMQAAPEMASEMGGELSSSDARTVEVKKIGNAIVSSTRAKKSPWKFQFHVLADPKTINAFALPGGQIFITKGLES